MLFAVVVAWACYTALEFRLVEQSDAVLGSLCLGSQCAQQAGAASVSGTFAVQIDTASDLLIVASSSCKRCGTARGYDATASTSSSRVLCSADADCGSSASSMACRSGACHFSVAFEDGGAAYGSVLSDTLWSSSSGAAMRVTFGCAHGMTGSLRSAAADGVWGIDLAGLRRIAPIALTAQLPPSSSEQRDTAALAKRPLLARVGADLAAGIALAQTLMSSIVGAPTAAASPASAGVSARVCLSSSGGGLLTLGVGAASALAPLRAPSGGGVGARVLAIDVATLRVTLPDDTHRLLPLPAASRHAAQHGAWRADAPPPLGNAALLALPRALPRATQSVPLPPFEVALDTGSSFSYVGNGAFRGLRAAFEAACTASKCGGKSDESYDAAMCWRVARDDGAVGAASTARAESGRFALALSAPALARFPTLRITLAGRAAGAGADLDVLPATYLHRITADAVCAGFFRSTDRRRRRRLRAGEEEPGATAALGLSALRGSTLLLDGADNGVGVVPAACS